MKFLSTAIRRIRALFNGDSLEQDMDREMRAHLELLSSEYEASGMSPEDARMAARRRFGNTTHLKERGRDIRGAGLLGEILRDARYALRGFARTPGFTAAVVVILAIGIGANAAIFSIVDQLLLDDLPYPDGEQLVAVYSARPPSDYNVSTPENWLAWHTANRSFSSLAAWSYRTGLTLTGQGEPEALIGQAVSAEFLPLLGVEPLLGRAFSAEEDRPNSESVMILSHGLWQRRFGSAPDILGRRIELNAMPYRVVGVMPEGFTFVPANGPSTIDYWIPFGLNRNLPSASHFIFVVGRLKPGVMPETAQSELSALNDRLVAERGYGKEWRVHVTPFQADRVRNVRASLLLLFAAVGALVLLACFNVAGLLLARSVHRRQEMTIRVSLGAGRAAILRQLLTEGVVLALAGGGLGILVSQLAVRGMVALAPISLLETMELGLDAQVLLYVLGLSLTTAIVFTLAPVLTSGRQPLAMQLSATSRTVTRTTRLRQGLVVAQVALALILVSGAALLGRTLRELLDGDNGLTSRNVLSIPVALPNTRYDRTAQIKFFQEAVERLGNLPGVQSGGAGRTLPITGVAYTTLFHVRGTPELPPLDRIAGSNAFGVRIREVTPGYFRTLGVPILRGREFSLDDQRESAPGVFIVNEAFVRQYFPSNDPLGETMSVVKPASLEPEILQGRIVGIVGDIKEGDLRSEAAPLIFADHSRVTASFMTLFVRSDRPQSG
jgi:predicted permease